MKFFQLTIIALFALVINANAQVKAVDKAIIKTPGITCEICKDRVERYLFRSDGISSVKADYKKHTVSVTWITDRTNIETIKALISNAGYDADDVTADEDAYKKLPLGCKKPAVLTPPPPVPEVKPAPALPKPAVVAAPNVVTDNKVIRVPAKKPVLKAPTKK
jgi:periplasmic mercuric ion binding protein